MAYREVSRVEIAEVVRRWQSGISQRGISTGTGLSRATVRRYIEAVVEAGLARDGPAPSEDQLARLAGLSLAGPRVKGGEKSGRVAERGGWDAPEAGQFLHSGQGRGAEQQERLLKPLAQGAQGRVRSQALQVDDDLERGRLNRSNAPADGAQDGGGHGAPRVAAFEKPPQGVAGHAEVLGCLAPPMQRRVGAHVAPDRSPEVRPGLRRVVQRLGSWFRDDQSTAPIDNSPTSHFEREIRPG